MIHGSSTADASFREVATGVGYEVRDFNGTGQRQLLITQDSTLGYVFKPTFVFTLLPPVGGAPKLQLQARAVDASSNTIGRSPTKVATFGTDSEVALAIADARCGNTICADGEACCGGACIAVTADLEELRWLRRELRCFRRRVHERCVHLPQWFGLRRGQSLLQRRRLRRRHDRHEQLRRVRQCLRARRDLHRRKVRVRQHDLLGTRALLHRRGRIDLRHELRLRAPRAAHWPTLCAAEVRC